jgi:hypothetical protein
MDSLKNLLGDYNAQEPPEIVAIKRYIRQHFDAASSIGLNEKTIIITVASGSLANTLRFHIPKLQAAANTEKTIIFRIG